MGWCWPRSTDCNVWLEYVQSGANISDLPSRGKFELLAEVGSISFPTILPPVGGDWEAVYTSLFTELAPRPSAGAKRGRARARRCASAVRRWRCSGRGPTARKWEARGSSRPRWCLPCGSSYLSFPSCVPACSG